jgi:hypothetical protein
VDLRVDLLSHDYSFACVDSCAAAFLRLRRLELLEGRVEPGLGDLRRGERSRVYASCASSSSDLRVRVAGRRPPVLLERVDDELRVLRRDEMSTMSRSDRYTCPGPGQLISQPVSSRPTPTPASPDRLASGNCNASLLKST